MYKVGDKIVYPMHGAAIIDHVEEDEIMGEMRKYFVLSVTASDMKLMIPVDKCDDIGVRRIITKKEVDGVLDVLRSPSTEMSDNWNRRNRENMEHLKTGDIHEVAGVVRNLLRIEKEKPLSTGEKKMLASARQILESELALVMGKTPEHVANLVEESV